MTNPHEPRRQLLLLQLVAAHHTCLDGATMSFEVGVCVDTVFSVSGLTHPSLCGWVSQRHVFLAKVAEQSERWDDMVLHVKEVWPVAPRCSPRVRCCAPHRARDEC